MRVSILFACFALGMPRRPFSPRYSCYSTGQQLTRAVMEKSLADHG